MALCLAQLCLIRKIALNNRGLNPEEVSEDLVSFLKYTRKPLAESQEDTEDLFVRRIQDTIRKVKASREMGEKYMQMQELLMEEHEEGRKEGMKQGIQQGSEAMLIQLVSKGIITLEQGADELGMSPESFRKMLKSQKANLNRQ